MTYSIPTSSRSRSTRGSAGPPGSAACSPAATRSPSSSDHGSRAGRSLPRSCSASTTNPPPARHFQDGTVNYLNPPAVEIGLCFLDRIGIETSHARVAALGAWLLDSLGALKHSDGSPAATIDAPRSWDRHATIVFGFLHPDGSVVDSATSTASPALTTSRFALAASAIPTPVTSHPQSRAKRSPGRVRRGDNARRPHPGTRPALRRSNPGLTRPGLDVADLHRFVEFTAEVIDLKSVPDDLPPRESC